MDIEYVEVRDTNRSVIGIIDTAQSIIWHRLYYGVGDFEIYAPATAKHLELLVAGNYITRLNDDEIGLIDDVNITYDNQNGRMITATGRFAKGILDRRYIYKLVRGKANQFTVISGKVETAVRGLVNNNAIDCQEDTRRNIAELELGAFANLPEKIVDEDGNDTQKQVAIENLLTYTESVLKEYQMAATVKLNTDTKQLQYVVYKGENHSTDNTDGNEPVIFSQEFDNLAESGYEYNDTSEKTAAIIGGEGDESNRFYSVISGTARGLARKETFVDASTISKKYKDENDVEQTYTDAEYKQMLDALGKQQLAKLTKVESFKGEIEITYGQFVLNRDFKLGDIVTIQDNEIGVYINARVIEITEAQDENGYTVEIVYE